MKFCLENSGFRRYCLTKAPTSHFRDDAVLVVLVPKVVHKASSKDLHFFLSEAGLAMQFQDSFWSLSSLLVANSDTQETLFPSSLRLEAALNNTHSRVQVLVSNLIGKVNQKKIFLEENRNNESLKCWVQRCFNIGQKCYRQSLSKVGWMIQPSVVRHGVSLITVCTWRIRYHCDRCADGSGHGATTLAADFSDKVSFVFIIQIEHWSTHHNDTICTQRSCYRPRW